jgi:hypothetical protein
MHCGRLRLDMRTCSDPGQASVTLRGVVPVLDEPDGLKVAGGVGLETVACRFDAGSRSVRVPPQRENSATIGHRGVRPESISSADAVD